MDKIRELIDQLRELKDHNASLGLLSHYTHLLQAEIGRLLIAESAPSGIQPSISVILPNGHSRSGGISEEIWPNPTTENLPKVNPPKGSGDPKRPESLQEPKFAGGIRGNHRPAHPIPASDFRFLPHQDSVPQSGERNGRSLEVNESIDPGHASWNEVLRQERTELGDKLGGRPVFDLKQAIGVNEQFLFQSELFGNNREYYELAIRTINGFPDLDQAEQWIRNELEPKLAWPAEHPTVRNFYFLVRKRFSSI